MVKLFAVAPEIEINNHLFSLLAFIKQKYSDRSIILVLVESWYSLLKNSDEIKEFVDDIFPLTEKIISSGYDVIVFQNTNYQKIKADIERGIWNDNIVKLFLPKAFYLTESNAFRNEKTNYFTFSPFQDTQRFFFLFNNGSSIKKQLCIRYLNNGDLTNPLFMSVHNCYSYQSYSHENQCEKMCSIIDILSNEFFINKKRIVVLIPKSCNEYMSFLRMRFKTDLREDDKYVARLNIPGTHFYVKVVYEHNNGLLPFINFVLVDIKNNSSQLDSIIYRDRLELIKENKTYIMQLENYKNLVNEVIREQPCLSDQELHEITNHFIAIFSMLFLRIKSGNNGVGNVLKRRVKALAVFIKYYVKSYNPLANIESIAEEIKQLYGYCADSAEVIAEFKYIYSSVCEVMERNINSLPKLIDLYSCEELIATFGIPKEEFGYRHMILKRNYPFVERI